MTKRRVCSKPGAQGPGSTRAKPMKSKGITLEDGLPRGLPNHGTPEGVAWRYACEDLLARLCVDQRPMPRPLLGLVRDWATVTLDVNAHHAAGRHGYVAHCRNQLVAIYRQAVELVAHLPKPKRTQASPWEKE